MSVTTAVPPTSEPTRIMLPKELIIGNRQLIKQQVLDLIHHGVREFVVDFAECDYVDSSGLGVLVSCSRRISEVRGSLVLEGLNDDLRLLFEMVKIDTLFTIRAPRP